eukprot:15485608-Alexandrium_andersonii.AAC.1
MSISRYCVRAVAAFSGSCCLRRARTRSRLASGSGRSCRAPDLRVVMEVLGCLRVPHVGSVLPGTLGLVR